MSFNRQVFLNIQATQTMKYILIRTHYLPVGYCEVYKKENIEKLITYLKSNGNINNTNIGNVCRTFKKQVLIQF